MDSNYNVLIRLPSLVLLFNSCNDHLNSTKSFYYAFFGCQRTHRRQKDVMHFSPLPLITYKTTIAVLISNQLCFVFPFYIDVTVIYGISFTIIYQTHISDCLVYNKRTIQAMTQQTTQNKLNIFSGKQYYKY
jgi:hypothetical protein